MQIDQDKVRKVLSRAQQRLSSLRSPRGHWEGHLSSSALSTATALFALEMFRRAGGHNESNEALSALVEGGLDWIKLHQNDDGGWGDTVQSPSNLSTTVLCWSALTCGTTTSATQRAEDWIAGAAGNLQPDAIEKAISAAYGVDRTFSVPILSMCALAGRFGPNGWRSVRQLPFELAVCPHRWFKWIGLPVVSYALPALIALGLARHRMLPGRNPLARWLRNMVTGRTLSILSKIQPATGGFLEAAPLTSFVLMNLSGAGFAGHRVAREAARFLTDTVRDDGSWPIDTNLATWLTTLAINGGVLNEESSHCHARDLCGWLLDQQHTVEHPYTRAAPGGWAWTDLAGGVPDADDTSGALLALLRLRESYHDQERLDRAAQAGVRWLVDLQNRDGGIPTFCRGWGKLPFDQSSADLTAHALRAWHGWQDDLPDDLQGRVRSATNRAVRYLTNTQAPNGSWDALWFGNQHTRNMGNPVYGTSRVIRCMAGRPESDGCGSSLARAAPWLLHVQNADGGWGGDAGAPSSIEETALAIDALASILPYRNTPDSSGNSESVEAAIARGVEWLDEHTASGFQAAPIGLYFAKLWYDEKLYPLLFTAAALTHLLQMLSSESAVESRETAGTHG